MPVNVEDGWQDDAWRTWPAPDSIVHGESHYVAALVQMTGRPRPQGYLVSVPVTLRLEPTNPHDPHAVRVEVAGMLVGYISRDMAPSVTDAMQSLGLSTCTFAGLLRGGYVDANQQHNDLGVMVWLTKRIEPGPSLVRLGTNREWWRWPPDEHEGAPAPR